MELIATVTTSQLHLGDRVVLGDRIMRVDDLRETDRPAAFGTGLEWNLGLSDDNAGERDIAAAADQRWQRVSQGS